MTEHKQDVDIRLEALGRATAGVRARPDLQARILLAVDRVSRPSFFESVTLSARTGFAVAMLAAAAAVVVAVQSESAATEAAAVAYGAMGMDW